MVLIELRCVSAILIPRQIGGRDELINLRPTFKLVSDDLGNRTFNLYRIVGNSL